MTGTLYVQRFGETFLVSIALVLVLAACSPSPGNTATSAPSTVPDGAVPSSAVTTSSSIPDDQAEEPEGPETTTEQRLSQDMTALLELGPREAGSGAEQAAAAYIAAQLRLVTDRVRQSPVPLPNGLVSSNITASFGEGPVNVLVGGHYDSFPGSPGADDNGSGVVVLLELARRLAEKPIPGLTATVAFFGAEEVLAGFGSDSHHFGSRQMVAELAAADALPDLMVAVDMVGIGEQGTAVVLTGTNTLVQQLIGIAADSVGVKLEERSRGEISDHESFAQAGVPSVLFWRPDNPDYHLATDTGVDQAKLIEDLAIVGSFLDLVSAGREPSVGG